MKYLVLFTTIFLIFITQYALSDQKNKDILFLLQGDEFENFPTLVKMTPGIFPELLSLLSELDDYRIKIRIFAVIRHSKGDRSSFIPSVKKELFSKKKI